MSESGGCHAQGKTDKLGDGANGRRFSAKERLHPIKPRICLDPVDQFKLRSWQPSLEQTQIDFANVMGIQSAFVNRDKSDKQGAGFQTRGDSTEVCLRVREVFQHVTANDQIVAILEEGMVRPVGRFDRLKVNLPITALGEHRGNLPHADRVQFHSEEAARVRAVTEKRARPKPEIKNPPLIQRHIPFRQEGLE